MPRKNFILAIIVVAQFCCTSLWFAGNAVMAELLKAFDLEPSALAHLTVAVQVGFIFGTLFFALWNIADRFSPSGVFFVSAVFGAIVNTGILLEENSFGSLLLFRFLTGFSLAGIYPVGMKLAADHFEKGLGTSLGYLVGALVLGTAFPHLVAAFSTNAMPWEAVSFTTSGFAVLGGILVVTLVPDGPFRRVQGKKDFAVIRHVFRQASFRSAAFGYFGHMWELYTFWAFIPVVLTAFEAYHEHVQLPVSLLSFSIIGIGAISCVCGGYVSRHLGTRRTASWALGLSGICCLLSPVLFLFASESTFLIFLFLWGSFVVADSPLFSTLVAQNAPEKNRGTALTIVNCIGFAITVLSIQLMNLLLVRVEIYWLLLLLSIGPAFGFFKAGRKI